MDTRRIIPISKITLVAFVLVGIFQFLVIVRVYELEASTVEKVAPFLHKPFLSLVGEHPGSQPAVAPADEGKAKKKSSSSMAAIGGFSPDDLQLELKGVEPPPAKEEPSNLIPVTVPKTEKKKTVDEDEPVG
ncbi:hypothetical protein [Pontiella desulfatans]|uniref:hypothetical protein n=1 Tax=Pontiella desulfatans TaxID=2750659 RepID=UPI00109C4C4D|nr:hypothetical protein [Pontiella desulfatans]